MGETLYGVLGVEPDADTDAIVGAYREKVKTTHPDVSDETDAEEQFKLVRTAKQVLTDPDERARYDSLGHETYVRRQLDSERWGVSVGTGQADRVAQSVSDSASASASAGEAGRTASTATQQRRADGYATAAAYYRPDERVDIGHKGHFGGTADALRDVAPWLLAHVALLVSSLVVGALLLRSGTVDGLPSFTSAVMATTMVGITLCLSLLHITSTVYR